LHIIAVGASPEGAKLINERIAQFLKPVAGS
jgi:hypothetical protein